MATKKPFVVKHGLEVSGNVVISGVLSSSSQNFATLTDIATSNTLMETRVAAQEVKQASDLANTNAYIATVDSAVSAQVASQVSAQSTNETRLDAAEADLDTKATWAALTSTNTAIRSYVDTSVAGIVDSAPAALDTLNELAAALGDDANFATTVSTNIGQKLGATASVALTGDVTGTGSFSANAVSITTTIADDSHNHSSSTGNFAVGGNLTVGGTVVATSSIQAYSDSRLKTDVEVIEGAVEKVKQVRGVTFTRIADDERDTGVIAQELEAVLPEAVHDNEGGMKSVSYGNIVGLLIEAIKEQQAQIDELKSQIK